ncbi:antiviral reverse transcriptase Drt3a [Geothrix sp. PMB-07]|uniref:antiviral reverse transcriptase Drt3a n=1 Tax=Geothrix sp. PMB-07 TaxID=3068640 RepID=UPI0027417948|nr:antiviral reverse transcriptase Drt3a [Geothrix sp. PMB-07]WLT30295.1 antiviral reverse transcriptase Drt3a [Geothrix sp. PMB-07]
MPDQSFSPKNLLAMLKKADFRSVPSLTWAAYRKLCVEEAIQSSTSRFNGVNPITRFHLKKKSAYRINNIGNMLVIRKLNYNLINIFNIKYACRSTIISNLIHFIKEGIPYRIYRLDVSQFYESFDHLDIKNRISSCKKINPITKNLTFAFLDYSLGAGSAGLPRGISLSSTISEMMMEDFDKEIRSCKSIYFYSRYVDDIVIITNASEEREDFINFVQNILPHGLRLNPKKQQVCEALQVAPQKTSKRPLIKRIICTFDYLGYQFTISDPARADIDTEDKYRNVVVDISNNKINKIKTRIARSVRDYLVNPKRDEKLLIDRIKYLTSNFYIFNKNSGMRNLAGIYYGFPALSKNASGLLILDAFLRNLILSRSIRIYIGSLRIIDSNLKRKLLSHKFCLGFEMRRFIYFAPKRMQEIQECWKYE